MQAAAQRQMDLKRGKAKFNRHETQSKLMAYVAV